jgi:NIPSNAP
VSPSGEADGPVLDLRTYRLVPGSGEDFDRLFRQRALPMLERFGIEVLRYGPSLEDADLYFLMRTFPSVAQRNEQLDAFYGSEEWRQNHRDAVLALIETYHTLLISLTNGQIGRSGARLHPGRQP